MEVNRKRKSIYSFEENGITIFSVANFTLNISMCYIYYLTDPITGKVMYVGQTGSPFIRYKQHLDINTQKNYLFRSWIISLKEHGKQPDMTVVEECDFSIASGVEMVHIMQQKEKNPELLNIRMIQHSVKVDRDLWYSVMRYVKDVDNMPGYDISEKIERFIHSCIENKLNNG